MQFMRGSVPHIRISSPDVASELHRIGFWEDQRDMDSMVKSPWNCFGKSPGKHSPRGMCLSPPTSPDAVSGRCSGPIPITNPEISEFPGDSVTQTLSLP